MKLHEVMLIGMLALLVAGPFWTAYRSRDQTLFWSPLTMFAAVFAYYFLIGPLIALSLGATNFYGLEFRDMMWKPWLAGAVSLSSIYLGFAFRTKRFRYKLAGKPAGQASRQIRRGLSIFLTLAIVGFAYVAYTSVRPFWTLLLPLHSGAASDISTEAGEGFSAGNYIFLLINLFIPAISLLAAINSEEPLLKRLLIIGLPVVQIVLFYASIGFRHRIVTLLISLAATTYLLRGRRPNPLALLAGAGGIVLLSGLIVLTRSYGLGLDLTQIQGLSFWEIFLNGFNDSGTFFTTALVMDSFPATFPYVGFNPLWIAVTMPIPRSWWPGKPLPEFLTSFEYLMGTQGQATPVMGEHYMMAGWPGIVIGGFIIGLIYRCFWEFYRSNPRNPLVVVLYAVSWALCFPVVNRGYLAQTLMEFFFDLIPLVLLFWICRKAMLARAPSGADSIRGVPPAINIREVRP